MRYSSNWIIPNNDISNLRLVSPCPCIHNSFPHRSTARGLLPESWLKSGRHKRRIHHEPKCVVTNSAFAIALVGILKIKGRRRWLFMATTWHITGRPHSLPPPPRRPFVSTVLFIREYNVLFHWSRCAEEKAVIGDGLRILVLLQLHHGGIDSPSAPIYIKYLPPHATFPPSPRYLCKNIKRIFNIDIVF